MMVTIPRLRETVYVLLFTVLLLSPDVGAQYPSCSGSEPCRNACEVCGYNGAGSSADPWYGLIMVDEFGSYVSSNDYTKAYDLSGEEMAGASGPGGSSVSYASCFVVEITVKNDGSYACRDAFSGLWDVAYCGRIIGGVNLASRSEAYNGRYTVLGEPTKKFPRSIDATAMSYADVASTYNAISKYIVLDSDYVVIGVDERAYVEEMWRQQQRRSGKTYESTNLELTYTIARTCDIVGVLNDTRVCKRDRIFDKRYDLIGSSEANVYAENIEMQGFEKCVWLAIDYGKFYKYPGVMIVLLNRSKFGTQKGFNFNAIVEQETQYANHVYQESVFAGSYPGGDFGAEECCEYQSGGGTFYKCVPIGTCDTDAACMWSSTAKGGCTPVANSYCANDCEIATSHTLKQAIYNWNSVAADRLIGCDKCVSGDDTCSMGSSLADARKRYPSVFPNPVSDWPPEFDEAWENCGYYNPWNMSHWIHTAVHFDCDYSFPGVNTNPHCFAHIHPICNCLTGWKAEKDIWWNWMCGEEECNECAKRGYGCQWETGGTNGCFNCYDPTPTGKPDENFIRKSMDSLYSVIDMSYVMLSWPKYSPVCGHNEDHDGFEWWTGQLEGPWGADNPHCSNGSGTGGEIGCGKEDCMYPWNQSAKKYKGPPFPGAVGEDQQAKEMNYMGEEYTRLANRQRQGWDLENRGGSVGFNSLYQTGRFNYADYPTNREPSNCSDWMGEYPTVDASDSKHQPPWFWGDRYSECTFDNLDAANPTFTCNCTRPEHSPKQHTPCDCPDAGMEVVLPGNFDNCATNAIDCWETNLNYYRLFNRDTVWSEIMKVSPEISNASIRQCTERVNCQVEYNNLRPVLVAVDPDITNEEVCNKNTSEVICDGCYYTGTACKDCVAVTNTLNVTKCSDYPSEMTCNKNGCNLERACLWAVAAGSCRDCPPKGSNSCSIYGTVDECSLDPCYFGGCGWDKPDGVCRTQGVSEKTCAELCGPTGGDCDKDECRLATVIAKDRCTYDTIVMGSPGTIDPDCLSCDKFTGGKCLWYGTKDSCSDDLCGFGCFWWKDPGGTNEQCRNCEAIQSVGCGEYTLPETCNQNTCGVEGGCMINDMDKCSSCAFVDSCDKYGKDSCFINPCGVAGGCGWNQTESKCIAGGSQDLCENTGLKECIEDMSTVTAGGCWASYGKACKGFLCLRVGPVCIGPGCLWPAPLPTNTCFNCNGKNGYPIKNCNDYRVMAVNGELDEKGKGACLRDDCDVGPCAWYNDGIEEKCITAFTAKPGEGFGWLRSGGTAGDTGENIGGGEFYTHAGGGINIPNQTEAEGFGYLELQWRAGSIWSEVIDEDTLLVIDQYRVESQRQKIVDTNPIKHNTPQGYMYPNCGWQNLLACDKNTLTCGGWTNRLPTEGTYIRDKEFKHYVETLKKRIPVSLSSSGKTPPSVCGTLCGKKVIEWPRYRADNYDVLLDIQFHFWNMTHGGAMNLTLNETALGSTISQLTRYGLFSKNAERRLDSRFGNVLPMPSHPYTHLNWFNMPEYKGDWKLRDNTANISLRGNYTFNVTLERVPLAMQCLWDGCLHNTGPLVGWLGCTNEHNRYICDAPCNPGAGLQQETCSDLAADNALDPPRGTKNINPNACAYPYYDAYLKCMKYTSIAYEATYGSERCNNEDGCCVCGDAQYNSSGDFTGWRSNFVWQSRCVSCWTHDRCDYPLVDETEKKQFIEEVNDSSSVLTDKYGENFSISRPLTGGNPTDNLNIEMKGYVDYDGYELSGYVKIKPSPDILNGFNIIFPERFIMEYNSKNYPSEHELYRTQITTNRDECIHSNIPGSFPGDDSFIWCSATGGTIGSPSSTAAPVTASTPTCDDLCKSQPDYSNGHCVGVSEDKKIAVTPAGYDDIGAELRRLGYSYDNIGFNVLNDPTQLSSYSAVFVNCAGGASSGGSAVQNFVSGGGYFHATDWAVGIVARSFPGSITFSGSGPAGTYTSNIVDSSLQACVGASTVSIIFDGGWDVITSVGPGVTVHVTADVPGHGTVPVAVSFSDGAGKVVYTSYHGHQQNTLAAKKIFECMIDVTDMPGDAGCPMGEKNLGLGVGDCTSSQTCCCTTKPDYVRCIDYGPYQTLKPSGGLFGLIPSQKEFESQTVICLNKQTKQFFNAITSLRQPENPYFILVNNPLKKYYHYADLFFASEKNYSWETVLYGIDAGSFWFDKPYWVDTSLALGVTRNYHEDEPNYYDLAALYPNPQVTKGQYPTLLRNYTVTNVHGIQLNKYANVDSVVQFDKEHGIYYVYFNSKSINASIARNAVIRYFTHFRSFDTPLFGAGGGPAPAKGPEAAKAPGPAGPVANTVAPRTPVYLEILVPTTEPDAFTDVTIIVDMVPVPDAAVDPNPSIFLDIGAPYLKQAILAPGGSYTFRIEKSMAVVRAKYLGSWNDDLNKGYAASNNQILLSPKYTSALNWILGNLLLILIAFAVIVSYRFFMDKRMDYYTMLQESGIYEMFKDFFGFK